jgi:hypothetical protein
MSSHPSVTHSKFSASLEPLDRITARWNGSNITEVEEAWLKHWYNESHKEVKDALLHLAGKPDQDRRLSFGEIEPLPWSKWNEPSNSTTLSFPALEYSHLEGFLKYLVKNSGPGQKYAQPSKLASGSLSLVSQQPVTEVVAAAAALQTCRRALEKTQDISRTAQRDRPRVYSRGRRRE